jgi:hypothetical protein
MPDNVLVRSYPVLYCAPRETEKGQVCFNVCTGAVSVMGSRIKSSKRFRSLRWRRNLHCTLRAYPSFRRVSRITAWCRLAVGLDFTPSKSPWKYERLSWMHVCKSMSGKSERISRRIDRAKAGNSIDSVQYA